MNSLLPPGSTSLERRLAQTCSGISDLQVPLRDLWNPATCPVSFLPYLAWAFSVDRWDEGWTESVKRQVVKDAFYIHQHKGTTSAVRRVVEPFGFLIRIIEWWQTGEAPGTFAASAEQTPVQTGVLPAQTEIFRFARSGFAAQWRPAPRPYAHQRTGRHRTALFW